MAAVDRLRPDRRRPARARPHRDPGGRAPVARCRSTGRSSRRACRRARRPSRCSPSPTAAARTVGVTVADQPFGDAPRAHGDPAAAPRRARAAHLPAADPAARHLRRRPGRGHPARLVRAVPHLAPATATSSASGSTRACSRFRALPTGQTRHLEGPSSDTSPQGNITFHRLRDYVVGDDLRLVHWRSSARTGRLVVKHNVDTSQPYTVVLLDLRPGRYTAESFEAAVDVAASVLVTSAANKAPVELRLTDGTVIGGPRLRDVTPLIDHLTGVQPDDDRRPAGSTARRCGGPGAAPRWSSSPACSTSTTCPTSPRCAGASTGSWSSRSTPRSTSAPPAGALPRRADHHRRRRRRGVRGVERAGADMKIVPATHPARGSSRSACWPACSPPRRGCARSRRRWPPPRCTARPCSACSSRSSRPGCDRAGCGSACSSTSSSSRSTR